MKYDREDDKEKKKEAPCNHRRFVCKHTLQENDSPSIYSNIQAKKESFFLFFCNIHATKSRMFDDIDDENLTINHS